MQIRIRVYKHEYINTNTPLLIFRHDFIFTRMRILPLTANADTNPDIDTHTRTHTKTNRLAAATQFVIKNPFEAPRSWAPSRFFHYRLGAVAQFQMELLLLSAGLSQRHCSTTWLQGPKAGEKQHVSDTDTLVLEETCNWRATARSSIRRHRPFT